MPLYPEPTLPPLEYELGVNIAGGPVRVVHYGGPGDEWARVVDNYSIAHRWPDGTVSLSCERTVWPKERIEKVLVRIVDP